MHRPPPVLTLFPHPALFRPRGLEIHAPHDGSGDELHCWIERGVVRRGYGWSVPAGGEVRVGVGSYDPHRHVKEPTVALAERGDRKSTRLNSSHANISYAVFC